MVPDEACYSTPNLSPRAKTRGKVPSPTEESRRDPPRPDLKVTLDTRPKFLTARRATCFGRVDGRTTISSSLFQQRRQFLGHQQRDVVPACQLVYGPCRIVAERRGDGAETIPAGGEDVRLARNRAVGAGDLEALGESAGGLGRGKGGHPGTFGLGGVFAITDFRNRHNRT